VPSEDPAAFNDNYLSQFTALAFLSKYVDRLPSPTLNATSSDDILDTPSQRQALNTYLLNGGHLLGFHAGNAALFDLPCFGTAIGAFFDRHPDLQPATFLLLGTPYPSLIAGLPDRWTFDEEVYQYRSDPRATNITVLLTVDDASYTYPENGTTPYFQGPAPHPIAWLREGPYDLGNGTGTNGMNASAGDNVLQGTFLSTGRMFYTSLGHLSSTWEDPVFQAHIGAGINWVLEGATSGSASVQGPASTSGVQQAQATSGGWRMGPQWALFVAAGLYVALFA
jgi:type 1 glutamine amidotransferase